MQASKPQLQPKPLFLYITPALNIPSTSPISSLATLNLSHRKYGNRMKSQKRRSCPYRFPTASLIYSVKKILPASSPARRRGVLPTLILRLASRNLFPSSSRMSVTSSPITTVCRATNLRRLMRPLD